MFRKFVVIIVSGYRNNQETEAHYFESEAGVIDYALRVSNPGYSDEPTEVKRIFSFDEYGHVKHYGLELKGFKLSLVERSED